MKLLINITFVFIFCSVQSVVAQDFEWAKHFRELSTSSPKEQYVSKVILCPDKGVLICGRFEGTMDFNPGIQDTTIYSSSLGNGFIIKLDSLGEFDWLSRVIGNYGSGIEDISLDDQGNVYSTGFVKGIGTLDVGGGNVALGAGAQHEAFVMKHTPDGNFMWSQIFEVSGLNGSTGHELLVVSNKLFLAGKFGGDLNVNPSGSPINISSTNGTHFLICLDTNSTYNWSHQAFNNADDGITLTADSSDFVYYTYTSSSAHLKKFDLSGSTLLHVDWGSASLVIEDVAIDVNGGIYLTGRAEGGAFQSPIYDLNPGAGVYEIPQGIFYARLDHNGNFYHGKSLAGWMYNDILYSSGFGIAVDYLKNMYITGRIRAGGISGNNSAFIYKYDSLGNQIWTEQMGSTYDDYGLDIVVDEDLNIYASGGFDCTVDFNPGIQSFNMSTLGCQDTYSEDGYLLKWNQDSCDHLGIILDTIVASSCLVPGFVEAHGVNSESPYLYSWDGAPFGSSATFAPAAGGNYTLVVKAANQCERTRDFHVPGPTVLGVDAQVNTTVTWMFSPDIPGTIHIDAFNSGCTASSGEIAMVMPQDLIYDSASVNPDFIYGDTLIWNYSNFDYQTPHFNAKVYYTGDTVIQLGDTLCYPVWITPLVDEDPMNNEKTFCQLAATSYDPNEKYVYPPGECIPNYIDTAQRLTYTIMFQNTGTSEALNIYILDTISPHLDLSSLEIVATSHTMMTEILPDDVLKFRFDNIHLLDSTTNVEESSGYVIFEISQKDSLPNNTEIRNSASIFFDYNVPVFTSQVLNTVIDVIPSASSSSFSQTVCDSIETLGNWFSTSGVHPIVISNSFGCDSTLWMDLTVKHSTESFISATVCDEYTVGNLSFSNSGSYNHYITNAVGCDSLVHLDLIVQNTSSSIVLDTCGSLDLNGVSYTSSGVYTQILGNAAGCDSIITIDLTLNNPDSNIGVSGCDSVDVNGVFYSSSGSYQQNLVSVFGCDSILTLNVTLDNSSTVFMNETICDDFTLNGVTYANSGSYYQYFTNSVGCDSIVSLNLTVVNDSDSIFYLEGIDSVSLNGQTYTSSGFYTQNLTNAAGCDSLINIHVSLEFTDIVENGMSITISPNPTSGIVYIQGDLLNQEFQVIDALGRFQHVVILNEEDRIKVDLSELSNGLYYLVGSSLQPQPIIKN